MEIKKIIQDNFKVGQILKNWTPLNGYKGENIIITYIDSNSIDFEAPNPKKTKPTKVSVPYSAINQIYEIWDDIKTQKIKRSEYTHSEEKPNHFTRYCLDILKELDNQALI